MSAKRTEAATKARKGAYPPVALVRTTFKVDGQYITLRNTPIPREERTKVGCARKDKELVTRWAIMTQSTMQTIVHDAITLYDAMQKRLWESNQELYGQRVPRKGSR